jgi:catechol 2,3-dioxygenase-like lactoylglutathione lyase family enzyme
MPSSAHHVSLLTHDPDAVLACLTDVLGLQIVSSFFAPGPQFSALLGVPANDGARCWVLGKGTSGLIEVCEIPEKLRGSVEPGLRLIAFAVGDAEKTVARARTAGVEADDPVHVGGDLDITCAVLRAGGVGFEVVTYH